MNKNEKYITEASLEDSFIFGMFNKNNTATTQMVSFIKSAVLLDKSYIEEQYIQMKRTRLSPLVEKVLAAFDRGDIQLMYSKTAKIPVSIPFIVRRDDNRIVATIFISNFTALSKDGESITIPMKNLYVLMESAYIALYIQTNPGMIQRNTALMKVCNSVYTSMFMRILNKDYSLSLDKNLFDDVSFIVSRFFLEKMWEIQNKDIIYNYAASTCLSPNYTELTRISDSYDEAEIKDISDLLLFIKTLSPRMESISVRFFIERYMNTYQGGAIMAIDYLPYLFFVIINILLGASLMKQMALIEIVKNTKGMNLFYAELSKIIE